MGSKYTDIEKINTTKNKKKIKLKQFYILSGRKNIYILIIACSFKKLEVKLAIPFIQSR